MDTTLYGNELLAPAVFAVFNPIKDLLLEYVDASMRGMKDFME